MTAFDYPDFTAQSGRVAVATTYDQVTPVANGNNAGLTLPADLFGNVSVVTVTCSAAFVGTPAGLQVRVDPVISGGSNTVPGPAALLGDVAEVVSIPVVHLGYGMQVELDNATGAAQNVEVSVDNYTMLDAAAFVPIAGVYVLDAVGLGAGATSAPVFASQAFQYQTFTFVFDAGAAFTLFQHSVWCADFATVVDAHENVGQIASAAAAGSDLGTTTIWTPGTAWTIRNDSAGAADFHVVFRAGLPL